MRVELELLSPDSSDMLLIDPNDPAQVARAREVDPRSRRPLACGRDGCRARPGAALPVACPVRPLVPGPTLRGGAE